MGAALDYLEQQGSGDLAKGRDLLIANAELSALCMRTAAEALGTGTVLLLARSGRYRHEGA